MSQNDVNPAKPDNLFGVCNSVGEAFGFNPLFLRVGFVFAMLASAKWAILAYVALGMAVGAAALVSRFTRRAAPTRLHLVEPVAQASMEAKPERELLAA